MGVSVDESGEDFDFVEEFGGHNIFI